MGTRLLAISLVIAGFLAASSPLLAHHGNASYDTEKTVTVKGTVTAFIWANPHVFLRVDAKDESGAIQHWVIEAENVVTQAGKGWSNSTFKPGDEVAIEAIPARNGQPIGRFRGRIVINGQELKTN